MEPLTTGAIALLLFFGKKLIDWGISKAYDTAFNQLTNLAVMLEYKGRFIIFTACIGSVR